MTASENVARPLLFRLCDPAVPSLRWPSPSQIEYVGKRGLGGT